MSAPKPAEHEQDPIRVEVVRDARLRTRIHWEWNGDQVRVRAPRGVPQRELDRHIAEIVEDVKRRRARVRGRADKGLEALARETTTAACDTAAQPAAAWAYLQRVVGPEHLVVITGSFYIAAEMRRLVIAQPLRPAPTSALDPA